MQSQQARPTQYSQTSYPHTFGLSQPQGIAQPQMPNSFAQQSVFMQTPLMQTGADLYPQSAGQYRLQAPFPQTQHVTSNPNTVLISSATGASNLSNLISATMKASPSQNFGTIGTKSGAQIPPPPYGQSGLTATTLSPSQLYIPYEHSHMLASQQNLATSHLLSSQLLQRPGPAAAQLSSLSGIQAIQPPTSYYSSTTQNTPPSATYFQAATPGSPLQAAPPQPVQQAPPSSLQTMHQFNMQGFGLQSQMGVLPPAAATLAQAYHTAPTGHPFKAQHELSSPIRSHTRSPASFLESPHATYSTTGPNSASSGSSPVTGFPQISSPGGKNMVGLGLKHQSQVAKAGPPQPQDLASHLTAVQKLVQQQQYEPLFSHNKVQSSTVSTASGIISSPAVSGSLATQMISPSMLRHATSITPHLNQHHTSQVAPVAMKFPSPIQRPSAHGMLSQAPLQQPPLTSAISQHQRLVPARFQSSSNKSLGTQPPNSAQQAKLRAEAVQQTQMFFNQQTSVASVSSKLRTGDTAAGLDSMRDEMASGNASLPSLNNGEQDAVSVDSGNLGIMVSPAESNKQGGSSYAPVVAVGSTVDIVTPASGATTTMSNVSLQQNVDVDQRPEK